MAWYQIFWKSCAVFVVICILHTHDLINLGISLQSLRGPRGGMIFFKKDPVLGVELESAINNAVFPGLQVSWTHLFCFVIRCMECCVSFILCGYPCLPFNLQIILVTYLKAELLCRVALITTQLGDLQLVWSMRSPQSLRHTRIRYYASPLHDQNLVQALPL